MANKGLIGLALGAGLVVFLAVLFVYYPRGVPQVEPTKPEAAKEMPYRTAPEFNDKSAAVDAASPPVQEPPPAPLAKADPEPAATPGPAAAEPAATQAPSEPQPEEQYGLLMGRYRTHKEALKVMEKLQKEGKPGFLRHDGRQSLPYAVWAGPFPSPEDTRVAAASIKKKLKVSPRQEKLQLTVPK